MSLWTYNKQGDGFMFYSDPESPEILARMREFELQQQQGPHASIHATNLNLNYNHSNINYWEMLPLDVQNIIKEKLS